jgi:hypothetical protein
MTHIICRTLICVFWEQGVCSAEEIEYEPDVGCLTFQDLTELEQVEEGEAALYWEEEEDSPEEDGEAEWDGAEDWEDEEEDLDL